MRRRMRNERREAEALGANAALYRRSRRAGASHDEVLSVLHQGRSFWRYQLFRAAGASHAEALALESEGVDAFSYRDLRHIGVGDDGILDARRRGLPLDVYFSARKAGLSHEDAAAVIGAGFRHAASAGEWKMANDARQLLTGRAQATPGNLTLVVRRTPGFKGDAEELVSDIVGDVAERAA